MSAHNMPLSGAILVTNPRRSEPVGLALTNPNDRRRINAAARAHVKTGASIQSLVKMITDGKSAKAIKKKHGIYVPVNTGAKQKSLEAAIAAGAGMSEEEKNDRREALARARQRIASALDGKKGYGPSTTYSFGKKKTRSYSSRALGSQAARYRVKAKKAKSRVSKKGKTYKVFGKVYPYPAGKVVKKYASDRDVRRKQLGQGYGHGRADMPQDMFKRYPTKGAASKPKAATGRSASGAGKGWMTRASAIYKGARGNLTWKEAQERARQFPTVQAALAVSNPGVFGGLALTNPAYDFMGFAKYSATALIAGGVSYKIHEIAVPWVQENVYDRVPVVGEYLNQYPYAATGVIASGALGIAAAKIGGVAGMYLGVIAGAVALTGGVLQAQEMLGGESLDVADELEGDADLAGLAMTNPGVFSGLALENNAHAMHGLALENPHDMAHLNGIAMDNGGFGDGMAYQVSPLAMPDFSEGHSEYSGASLADALVSGADLSVDEGNAAVIGKAAYLQRFGHPTVRRYAMGAPRGRSHLAGRPGHRWGWLIKMIGFQRFQALASLPPKKRLAVIKKMRASAIQAFKAEMADQGVPPAKPEFVSGVTATVPGAANGPGSSYGAMLMASPSYL